VLGLLTSDDLVIFYQKCLLYRICAQTSKSGRVAITINWFSVRATRHEGMGVVRANFCGSTSDHTIVPLFLRLSLVCW